MSGREPEEVVRHAAVIQAWCDITFLHWACDPDEIAKLLPPGLEPDVHDGKGWFSLTPFTVRGQRLAFAPAVPKLSDYPETNVRTYVKDSKGLDGLWFLTVEVDNLPTAMAIRSGLGVPYRWASMTVSKRDERTIVYEHQRRNAPNIRHHIEVTPGDPLDDATQEEDELAAFLTGRWRGLTHVAGQLVVVPVHHQPWPLHRAKVERLEETLIDACGLPEPAGDPLVHWSPGVEVRFGPPRLAPG